MSTPLRHAAAAILTAILLSACSSGDPVADRRLAEINRAVADTRACVDLSPLTYCEADRRATNGHRNGHHKGHRNGH